MPASGDELCVPWRMDGAKMGQFVRQPMPFNAICVVATQGSKRSQALIWPGFRAFSD